MQIQNEVTSAEPPISLKDRWMTTYGAHLRHKRASLSSLSSCRYRSTICISVDLAAILRQMFLPYGVASVSKYAALECGVAKSMLMVIEQISS